MSCRSFVLVRAWWWDVDVPAVSPRNSERDSVAISPLGFRTASTHSRAALRIPRGIGARDNPEAASRRHRGLPDPRRFRPTSPGSRNACAGSQQPTAPDPTAAPLRLAVASSSPYHLARYSQPHAERPLHREQRAADARDRALQGVLVAAHVPHQRRAVRRHPVTVFTYPTFSRLK